MVGFVASTRLPLVALPQEGASDEPLWPEQRALREYVNNLMPHERLGLVLRAVKRRDKCLYGGDCGTVEDAVAEMPAAFRKTGGASSAVE